MRDINEGLDWDIFAIEGVEACCTSAARAISRHAEYGQHVTFDDLEQEAFIIAASMGEEVRLAAAGKGEVGLGGISLRIKRDLMNMAHTQQQRGQRNTSYEERYNPEDGVGIDLVAPNGTSGEVVGYTRELIESLIPAIWDEDFCYGVTSDTAADPDMPRGSTNKAHGSTLLAHIADIKVAWKKAPLRLEEKRALILAFGLDWGQQEIAQELGATQSAISKWITSGTLKLLASLGEDE